MIVLLCTDPSLGRDISEDLKPTGQSLLLADTWEDLPCDARARACACVCAYQVFTPAARHAIDQVHRDAPALPIVLITSGSRENSRLTGRTRFDDVIWLEDAKQDLMPAITAVTAKASTIERFAQIIAEDARGVDIRIHHALLDVCRSAPPVPSIGDIATMAIMCESKARQKIRSFFGNRPRAASRFLAWVLLLSAYDLGRRGLKPPRIAERLEVDQSTLAREIKQLAGHNVKKFLDERPRAVLRQALEDLRMLPPRRGG